MDETEVDGTWSSKENGFTAANSHEGGYKACSSTKRAYEHVKIVVYVPAFI